MSEKRPVCFVIMPIKGGDEFIKWQNILNKIIKPAIVSSGIDFEIIRVDENQDHGNWLRKITQLIGSSELAIADLTTMNPNVIWELGLRHGAKKNGTIMITQDFGEFAKNLSDLTNYDVITYQPDGSDLHNFSARISVAIKKIMNSKDHCDSPFHEFNNLLATSHSSFQISLIEVVEPENADELEEIVWVPKDDSKTTESLEISNKTYEERETYTSTDDFIAEYSIDTEDSDAYIHPEKIDEYNQKIEEFAGRYVEWSQKNATESREKFRAVRILPKVFNDSDRPITDVQINFEIDQGGYFLEKLPDPEAEPIFPKRPKKKVVIDLGNMPNIPSGRFGMGAVIKQMNTIGHINSQFDNLTVPSWPASEPMRIFSPSSIINNPWGGCWVSEENKKIFDCHTDKIRQQVGEDRWDGVFFVPNDDFKEATVTCEIRSPDVQGVVIRKIKLKIGES